MAEVVGVVAAGFAFGEVALAHVFKLKHMWEDMKEIPDHVRMFVHEIELLSRVLHEMEADLNSPSQDGASWGGIGVLIVSICRSAVDVLDASVNAVSQELASVRGMRWTMRKVKLVLKKDFWSKIENRLQHVVGLLGIAQQYWLRSLTQRQPDVIVSRLQLLQGAVQPDHIDNSTGTLQDKDKTPGPRPKAMKYSTDRRGQLMQKHRGCSWLGSVGLDWTQSRDDNQGTAGGCNTYYIQLKPPNWLTRKAWSVVSSLSVSGFDITLRAYSVVPRNSPVMECAAVGDVGGLLDLFDKGLASPFDIDPDGNGLLEVAIQREGVSALAVMMSWGLDLANCFEPTAARPTTMFFLLNGGDEKELQVINEMALASNVYETWADRWTDGFFNRDFYWQCMASNVNSVKVFLPRLRPGHYQLPIRDRLGWMPLLSLVPAHSLRYILWKDGKARMEDVRALDEIQYPLIKLVATLQ